MISREVHNARIEARRWRRTWQDTFEPAAKAFARLAYIAAVRRLHRLYYAKDLPALLRPQAE